MNNYNYESVKSESGGAAYASSSATKNYSQADLGQNPTVNLATGRLRYAFADLSVGGGNFAVNVNHVYASSLYAPCAGKFNNVFGSNWKLNLSQCVICEGGRYYYMDESGEIHRFLKFDANRYHDVRNAKTVLTKQTDGYVIADGVGNKLYFNSDGLLCKSVSCHNDAMVKRYEYDSNGRLIRVYDNRLASNKIELNYEDNKLSCITSYSNNKKLLSLRYAYEGDNLVSVHKVAYTRTSKESISKQILAFAYNGAYLSFTADCETKSAQRYEYASGKVSKVTQGAMTYNGLTSGSCDASNSPLSLGTADCSPLGNETFVPIKWNEYAYPVISDGMSVETDVTNENGITLAYFIDGNACITSSFEKMPDGKLKTLTKQGTKRTDKLVSNTTSSINGNFSRQASGEIILNLDNGFNLYRNHAEKSYNIFSYSFWLNISNTYAVLEAELTCKFKDNSEYVNKIYVDSTAKNAWQKVVIPFSVPTDSNGKPIINNLKTLSIKLFADKSSSVCYDSFLINEIGFAPSAMTKFRFFSFDKSFYLPDVKFVTSGNSKYVIDKIMYFTENDVLATLANKKTNNNFDIICCNGTQRFANFQEMYFSDGINRSEVETNMVDIVTNYPDDKTITLNYVFGDLGLFLTIYVSKNTSTRESSVTSDYHNNILKEVSEYNVTKEYSYDDYGRLITVKTTGFNKAVTLVTSYHYDSEGRLINSHDELDGQRVDYTDYGQISKIIECQVSDNAAIDTTHSVENKYGVFKERLLEVSDCDGKDKLSGKKITYENGRIRTVSDGVAKYGVAYNLTNNEVSYTQFNPYGNEELLQQDKITHVKSNGAILQNRHCSQFYNDGKQKDKITTEADKYNRVTAVSYQTGQNEIRNHYDYSAPAESEYAAVPKNFTDAVNNLTKEFSYDVDNNLVGWTEKENGKELFKIQRIADGITKTCFGTIPYTFSVTQYDNPSVINPRVASTDFCFNQKDEINVGGLLRPFFNRYEYDGIGRIARKYSEYNSGYTYKYGTGREQKLLVGQDYNNYVDTKNPSSNYEDPDVTLSERMYPDYAKLKTVSKISYNDLHDSNNKKTVSIEATHLYNFDKSHRLTKDSFTRVSSGTTTRRVSDYSYCPDGRLSSVKLTDGSTGIVLETKSYTYDKQGRLSGINDGTSFGYDSFGNRTKQTRFGDSTFYEYKYGGNLHKVKRGSTVVAEYGYNENGVRLKKLSNGKTTRYMLDGNKILGEITGNKTTYYVYDLDGLNGFARIDDEANEEIYIYVRDTQNNIVMLTSIDKRMVARYEYDSFGNCTVYGEDGRINADPNFIGNINPFRWKSFYYDTETGLYYANGSYYDPKTGLYVDASPLNTVIENAFTTVSLDRNAPVCNNILELAGNPYTIEIATDLHPDPTYEGFALQWWHWAIGGVLALVSFVLAAATAGLGFALASTVIGGAIGAGYGAATANYTKQDVKTGALLGMISGIIMGNTALLGPQLWTTGIRQRMIKGVLYPFIGGAVAGAYSEYYNQTINYGGIIDKSAIFISAIEYGAVNILSMFTGVLTNGVVGLEAVFGIYMFDLIMSTVTLSLDVLKA